MNEDTRGMWNLWIQVDADEGVWSGLIASGSGFGGVDSGKVCVAALCIWLLVCLISVRARYSVGIV